MEGQDKVTYDGDGWRLLPRERWTAAQYRAALHFPSGRCPTSGAGRVVYVCGMGYPPEAADAGDARMHVATSVTCERNCGRACLSDGWDGMVGRTWPGEPDVLGAAPSAVYLTAPTTGREYLTAEGGAVAEWLIGGWAGRIDVIVLPPSGGGGCDRWAGAIRAAVAAGVVVVADAGWRAETPDDVRIICPAPYRGVDGHLSPLGEMPRHSRLTAVPVVATGHRTADVDRVALGLVAGLVLSSLAASDPVADEVLGRVASAHRLMTDVDSRHVASRGIPTPAGGRGWARVYPARREPRGRMTVYAGGPVTHSPVSDPAVPTDLSDPRM